MLKARISRWGSATLFAGIVLAFFLPFATVSCDGEDSFQRSGEIAVMDADGSNERVLTQVNGATTSSWSPDSRELVFTRELYGGGGYFSAPSALMVVDVESRNVRRLTWGPEPVIACGSPG